MNCNCIVIWTRFECTALGRHQYSDASPMRLIPPASFSQRCRQKTSKAQNNVTVFSIQKDAPIIVVVVVVAISFFVVWIDLRIKGQNICQNVSSITVYVSDEHF